MRRLRRLLFEAEIGTPSERLRPWQTPGVLYALVANGWFVIISLHFYNSLTLPWDHDRMTLDHVTGL